MAKKFNLIAILLGITIILMAIIFGEIMVLIIYGIIEIILILMYFYYPHTDRRKLYNYVKHYE